MPRYALKIEYHGGPFSGWQRQADRPSVQAAIEAALAKLEPDVPSLSGAGRTDAGVHATGQVAHIDLQKEWDPFRLCEALNYHLKPAPISILVVAPVSEDFHARFSANRRRYLYRLIQRRAPLTQQKGLAWRVNHPIALEPMQIAARFLLGHHDFTTFRSTICQAKSPVKTLDRLDVEAVPIPYGTEFLFHVEARSFLHNQVRSFVGTLERVGSGSWAPDRVKTALEATDRAKCGPVAPPDGLYLAEVGYDPDPFS